MRGRSGRAQRGKQGDWRKGSLSYGYTGKCTRGALELGFSMLLAYAMSIANVHGVNTPNKADFRLHHTTGLPM